MQVYVRKMSICLLDISDDSDSSSLEQLQCFSLELTGLFVSFWIANPQHIVMLHSVNMQTGQVFQEAAPEKLHKNLLVCMVILLLIVILYTVGQGFKKLTNLFYFFLSLPRKIHYREKT